ncbi:hypothetical protein JTF06_12015 [Desemzia sp. RIT804]|uniref:hypothetical protein n=1 Tax=Desemzia sp. RIT 804 TaxID=2810209 RepID=UPI001952181B|nr:hypothetical protein [Desemzia sp. RIT 804]MBM6615611.1 hypothetical protein [Desemzia sp. RIT 804]
MEIYAIVEDGTLEIARHLSKGTGAMFTDLKMLKQHAWRYKSSDKQYKIARYEVEELYDFKEVPE